MTDLRKSKLIRQGKNFMQLAVKVEVGHWFIFSIKLWILMTCAQGESFNDENVVFLIPSNHHS